MIRVVSMIESERIKTFPAYPLAGGEYKSVLDDSKRGLMYFRLNGKITAGRNQIQITSCSSDITELIYPVKQVVLIEKDKLNCEDDEDIFKWVVGKTIESGMQFQAADLNSISVLSGEYSNWREIVDIDYRYSYISIDWNVLVSVNLNCLCDETY
jgi:hypothetical protein